MERLEERTLLDAGLDQAFIARAYADLLGRAAEPAGEQFWNSVLQQGASRQAVALAIVQSPESWAKQVREAYENILLRQPESAGLQFWVDNRPSVGGELNLQARFFASPEYFRKSGGTVDGFVHALYHDILARDAEATGLAAWTEVLSRGTTSLQVAQQFLNSPEDTRNRVTGFYEHYLERAPETAGLNAWVSELGQGLSVEEVRSRFIGSPEYFANLIPVVPVSENAVLHWNDVALETVRRDGSNPPLASRNLAIVQGAVADAINAINGTPAYLVSLPAPVGAALDAAVAAAAQRALSLLYPAQAVQLDAALVEGLGTVPEGSSKTDGLALGRSIADAVIALRAHDGWNSFVDYQPQTGAGQWRPTAPMFEPALVPQWANLQPFVMDSPAQFRPSGPPALESQAYATAVAEVQSLGRATGSARTAEQTQIARFWADGSGTYTPPGHWNAIAEQQVQAHGSSLADTAKLFAQLDFALADAAIVAWDAKYTYTAWRPITAIQEAASDGNPDTQPDATWSPLLLTPPFPEYISGHSTFSAAAATILSATFGDHVAFDTTSASLPGVTRSFTSFQQAAEEAGQSRIYGGIHFQFSNQDGLAAGRALGQFVLDHLSQTTDTQPPRVVFTSQIPAVVAGNVTIQGQVLDNLSGVQTLQVQQDSGDFTDVTLDEHGNFVFTTTFPLNGTAQGDHSIRFVATDNAGNESAPFEQSFTLDTLAPAIRLGSPLDGGVIDEHAHLSGTADGTGSSITKLVYSLDGGSAIPIAFDLDTGEFDQGLNLARLAAGQHTLAVTAQDQSGAVSTTQISVHMSAAISFMVSRVTPMNGAVDVGSTFRPQVFFSRPVDPSSLTADNFFATGPSGDKLPTHIVPAADGSFAWLFFSGPMPGAAQITVHVLGDSIRAAGDGALLDADMSMMPGSTLTYSFATVSLTPLFGTSLSGKVLDPGPDLHPMTFDDIRAGPDGALHTADDVFLLPIAGVKVFVLGMEDHAVLTDAAGNFHFDSVPAGDIKLSIDGRTATNAPDGFYFPEMVMDLTIAAGRANTVMGAMGTMDEMAANRDRQEVYLPRLQKSILQNVSTTGPTMIHVDAAAAPNITAEQRQMLTLEVQPGSLLDQNGNPVAAGQVGISTVPPELVRDMLPAGLLQHTFDITVQAPGITNFSTPAPMTFPNLFGAAPGTQLNFLSFDHTTGRLVIEGTATVSADGLSVHTDPGTGITHPGWHGLTPPGSPTDPESSEPMVCDFPAASGLQPSVAPAPGALFEFTKKGGTVGQAATALENFLLTSEKQFAELQVKALAACGVLQVKLLVDGVDLRYINAPIAINGLTGKPIGSAPSYQMMPGDVLKFKFTPKKLTEKILRNLPNDFILGLKITIQISQLTKSGAFQLLPNSPEPSFLYRFVDVADENSNDGLLKFAAAVNDGAGGVSRDRPIFYIGSTDAKPLFTVGGKPFDVAGFAGTPLVTHLTFDPIATGDFTSPITLLAPGRVLVNVIGPGDLQAVGSGRDPYRIFIDTQSLKDAFKQLAVMSSPQLVQFQYGPFVPGKPSFFTLSYKGQTTVPILLSKALITPDVVRVALSALSTIGAGNIDVEVTHTAVKLPGGSSVTQTAIKVSFRNALATGPQDLLVFGPSGSSYVIGSGSVTRMANFGRITPNERQMFDTDAETGPLIAEVVKGIKDNYFAFAAGVQFVDESERDTASLTVNWELGGPGSGVLGETANASGVLKDLLLFAKTAGKFNDSSRGFRLSQILTKPRSITSSVFVDNILETSTQYELGNQMGNTAFVNELTKVATHEIGHGLGLQHPAVGRSKPVANENQRIVLSGFGPGEKFTLNFSGEITAPILATADGAQVQAALRALTTIGPDSDLVVDGPAGGPYSVSFVDPTFPLTQQSRFRGSNVPQLVGDTAKVTVTTIRDGESAYGVDHVDRLVDGADSIADGMVDTMVQGHIDLDGTDSFLPRFSEPSLRIATYLNWNARDVRDYLAVVTYLTTAHQSADLGDAADPGDPTVVLADPDDVELNAVETGRSLTIFQNGSLLGSDAADFGSVEVDGPGGQTAVQHFMLLNFGSEDVTVRGIQIVNSTNAFFTPAMPVTILHPGESIDIGVTFDPRSQGPQTGTLVIDSDAEDFDGHLDLTGTGLRTTADLRADPSNNDLGGAAVGQLLDRPLRVAQVTNYGVQPVTIRDVRVAPGPGENEFLVANFQPVTLQPGESLRVEMQFRPSAAGLRHGVVEILSDDPQTPIIRQPLVGTGLVQGNLQRGNNFVAVGSIFRELDGTPVLRTRSDAAGHWEFFLAPETEFEIVTFDPVSGLVAHGFGSTNPAGQRTVFNIGEFQASGFPDSDGDGLPDDIEFAIGTNPNKVDTDGDGVSDLAAINQGLNPLSDRPAITGVIGGLRLNGSARDIKLAVDAANPNRELAYIAEAGLAIVDVSRFDRPVLLSQLSLPGCVSIVVDSPSQTEFVAAGTSGVHVIDIADPTKPRLERSIPINASQVEFFEGLVYAASGNDIVTFDPMTLEEVQRLSLSNPIVAWRRDGAALFALTNTELHAIDLSGPAMVSRGSLALPQVARNLFVADGTAWISSFGADSFTQAGLMTVDVRALDDLMLISGVDRGGQFVPAAFALNGSGLGISTGPVGITGSLDVINAADPTKTGELFTTFLLPDPGLAITLASGLAYVADGPSGLQIVNFLAYDQGNQPPGIALNLIGGDLDLAKPGLQLLEASAVSLTARITDDVQVRNVELLVNGVVVRNEIAYPYDFSTVLPKIADGGTQATLQLRATDTGGNVQLSDPVVIELVADTIPPAILSLDPPEGSTQPLSFHKITVRFSEPLDPATVSAANFELVGPAGAISPITIRTSERGSSFEFVYPPLQGDYQFVIHAPQVTDRVGNPLGAADITRSFHVGNIVRVPTIHWIGTASGFWDDVANWDAGRLPGEQDDVEINVPGDVTVTARTAITVRSLVSNNALSIVGGTLKVTETMQVNNTFTLKGGFSDIATLNATVLRGTGGQGLTIGGLSRLEECNIQTDITLSAAAVNRTQLRIKGGLALLGTATLAGQVFFEGTQTISQGTFLFSGAKSLTTIAPSGGDAVVTLGPDVTVHGIGGSFLDNALDGSRLTLVNEGRIDADADLVGLGDQIRIQTTGFTNQGIVEVRHGSNVNYNFLSIDATTWNNAANGQILAADGGRMALGFESSVSWSNAGSISGTNQALIAFYAGLSQPNARWSNTGSISSRDSTLLIGGDFSSADVENFQRSGGFIGLVGTMDNTGRTFTFDQPKGSWEMAQGGQIIGGTIVVNTPVATLDAVLGTLDGVTIDGLLEIGVNHQASGFPQSVLIIRNGLTVNGTMTGGTLANGSPVGGTLSFDGTQTVHGVFDHLLMQSEHGQVTFADDVTIKNSQLAAGTLFGGSFLNLGTILVEAQQRASTSDGCINRGPIQVSRDGGFSLGGINEGTITVDHGLLFLGGSTGEPWHNNGAIDATASDIQVTNRVTGPATPADFGNLRNPGGTITLGNVDLANGTFVFSPSMCEQWILAGIIVNGTIRIDAGVTVNVLAATLKDVTIDGDLHAGNLVLAGDITIHGTVFWDYFRGELLTLGDEFDFRDLPLTIHAGTFDLSGLHEIQGNMESSGDITFGPDVILHSGKVRGGKVVASFVRPLLNLGQIISDAPEFAGPDSGIAFTNTTITNRGILAADGSILQIAHLATNEGTILAHAGGTVMIGGDFTQAATGIVNIELAGTADDQQGKIQVSGNATLSGTLQVSLVAGFTPPVGAMFQIATFAARSGTFATVVGWDLPKSVRYDDTDIVLTA